MKVEEIRVGSKFKKGVTQIEVVEIRISRLCTSEKQEPCVTDVWMKLQSFAIVSGMGTVSSGKPFKVNYREFMRQIEDWEEIEDASEGQGVRRSR